MEDIARSRIELDLVKHHKLMISSHCNQPNFSMHLSRFRSSKVVEASF